MKKTIRLKVRPSGHAWLNAAAREVNFVWNWANETSLKAIRRFVGPPKWLSGFDLCRLTTGAYVHFSRISANTINEICINYARSRILSKQSKLKWRKTRGAKKALGWVPFKSGTLTRKGNHFRFCGKNFRTFDQQSVKDISWSGGCFAEDACGDWWLCLCVEAEIQDIPAPREAVGIDLGLKSIATTSNGEMLAGTFYRDLEKSIGNAQKRGHRRQAKRISRKVARCRSDALHKFSRKIVNQYQNIFIGDVSSLKFVKTDMAKSVLDSGWGKLRLQLHYKGQQAGRRVEIIDEAYTSRACSSCGSLSGPRGVNGLRVRDWTCCDCGASHDRDINAARNILRRATGVRLRERVDSHVISEGGSVALNPTAGEGNG